MGDARSIYDPNEGRGMKAGLFGLRGYIGVIFGIHRAYDGVYIYKHLYIHIYIYIYWGYSWVI